MDIGLVELIEFDQSVELMLINDVIKF